MLWLLGVIEVSYTCFSKQSAVMSVHIRIANLLEKRKFYLKKKDRLKKENFCIVGTYVQKKVGEWCSFAIYCTAMLGFIKK